mmetsp:Transcript_3263/g.4493  ORF Transcript_3263/g.4493 Transcript_3263/m.4493 type:complete len:335 (-) Transcript_3263:464-1468(-)
MVANEGWVVAVWLNKVSYKLVQQSGGGTGLRAVHLVLVTQLGEVQSGLFRGEVFWDLDLSILFQSLNHRNSLEWRLKVDSLWWLFWSINMVLDNVSSSELLDHSRDQLFSHVHEVIVISISHVKFAESEFRIVSHINSLISEDSANFVDSVQTSNNELLQVQLRSNSHKELHLQIVMEGFEWLGSSSSSNHVQDGGFDFQESSGVQESSEVSDNVALHCEGASDILVHDEVEVSLSVSGFLVLQTSSLLWKHVQARREQNNFGWDNGKLSLLRLGSSWVSSDTNDITSSQYSVDLVKVSVVVSLISQNLNLVASFQNVVEEECLTSRSLALQTT